MRPINFRTPRSPHELRDASQEVDCRAGRVITTMSVPEEGIEEQVWMTDCNFTKERDDRGHTWVSKFGPHKQDAPVMNPYSVYEISGTSGVDRLETVDSWDFRPDAVPGTLITHPTLGCGFVVSRLGDQVKVLFQYSLQLYDHVYTLSEESAGYTPSA